MSGTRQHYNQQYQHGTVIVGTYASLEAIRAASGLAYDYLYQINDNTDAEGGDILLWRASPDAFSPNAIYIPNYDNTLRWKCHYDFPNNRILRLEDHRNNLVIGQTTINNWIWDDDLIFNNYIENSSITLFPNHGTISNNRVVNSLLTLRLNGLVDGNQIDSASVVLDWRNAVLFQFSGNVVNSSAQVSLSSLFSTSPSFSYNTISNGATVSFTNSSGNFLRNTIHGSDATITDLSGLAEKNEVLGDSSLSLTDNSGSFSFNRVSDGSVFNCDGNAGTVNANKVESGSEVNTTIGGGTLQRCSVLSGSTLNSTGNNGTVSSITAMSGKTVEVAANVGIVHENGIHARNAVSFSYLAGSNQSNVSDL